MSAVFQRTPKSGRQSLFFQDLATPISSRKSGGKFTTPGQAATVSALWRDNFPSSDLPPPPVFTLEDRSEVSPDHGIPDFPTSPNVKSQPSEPRTPVQTFIGECSTLKSRSEASTSYAVMGKQQQLSNQSPMPSSSWLSSMKNRGSAEKHGKREGSPVEGVVEPGASIPLPPLEDVARPEIKKNSMHIENLDEEEWVSVFGFSPIDINIVVREFEKCGVILKHIPGPRGANWMHILYQNHADAQKALSKNGAQINGVLIVGVKPVDPIQRQALNERLNKQGFIPLPNAASSKGKDPIPLGTSPHPYYLQNGTNNARQSSGSIATPAKSVVSKFADLMFGI